MRFSVILLAVALAVNSSSLALAQDTNTSAIESVYSDLGLDSDCVIYSRYEQGASFSCPGYGGYGVLFSEDDLRQSVFYGYVGEWFAEGAWEGFDAFNRVSGKVEWRLIDKVPYATIMRWFLTPADGSTETDDQIQLLVVSKVAQPGIGDGCVIGYVDARENDDANELARQIADTTSLSFRCRIDAPEYYGEQGIDVGVPVRTFGP